jgi:hypothetical protein
VLLARPGADSLSDRFPAVTPEPPYVAVIFTTVSYWRDMDSVHAWGAHPEHREAQRLGRERWYKTWRLRVLEVGVERRSGSD